MKTVAVIDGDIVAYRCAAANETRSIVATHKVTGQSQSFPHRTAWRAQIQGLYEEDEFTVVDIQTPDEINKAFHGINTTIKSLKEACGAISREIYLSGKDNFRDSLPLPVIQYKGNRAEMIRPVQLKECRKYLQDSGAKIIDGREVDDMLAQRCWEGKRDGHKNIACTIDGDQHGVEGWMYNWTKMNEPKLIQGLGDIYPHESIKNDFNGYGRKFFYAQWIFGDPVDKFKPCQIAGKKFGVVGLFKILADCKTDKECVQAVYDQYKRWIPDGVITYKAWDGTEHTKTIIEVMDMYAACAHMKRWEDDVFNTEALLDKLGVKR